MARSYLDKIGLGHLWDLIKSYFVKGNAKVFTGTCFSDASATDKVVTCSEFASTDLVVGAIISVKFTNTNSASVSTLTLNVNNTGSKGIRYIYNGSLNTIPNGNYLKANQLYQFTYDGTYWVVQLMYNTDTTSALRDDYGRYTAGSVGLFPYTLIMQLPDGRWESIVTSYSSGTSKIKNSHGFLLDSILYKASNSTITENDKDSTRQIYEHPSVCDYRYSFNIENTTALALVTGKPIYLVGTIKADGLFYLDDTWWTQALPSTEDGKVYIYLGQIYDWNRGSLLTNHPIYWFKDGHVTNYINNDSAVNADQQPYNFRKSGDGVVIGDTEYDKIIGASVVMNQLCPISGNVGKTITKDGINFTYNADGSIVLNGTATTRSQNNIMSVTTEAGTLISNHVYFIRNCPVGGSAQTYYSGVAGLVNDIGDGGLFKYIYTWTASQLRFDYCKDATFTNAKFIPKYIDLTQFFGSSTIADYIYSLEQTTKGSGVAWLKKYFPKVFDNGYIPYNTGSFEHVSGLSEHKMVGFNQWDEEWEAGTISGFAVKTTIHSKNFCGVLPNTTYYATCGKTDGGNQNRYYLRITFYDASKNFISSGYYNNLTFTTPENAAYFKIETNTSTVVYGNVYNHDICINLSDPSKNGTYEPYKAHSYPLDDSLTLRGIPKLVDGKVCFDGDTYDADGTVTRKYGIVDLGTLNWQYNSSHGYFLTTSLDGIIARPSSQTEFPNAICSRYEAKSWNIEQDKTFLVRPTNNSGTTHLWIKDSSYTTSADFKAAMSGVMLVYELDVPIIEQAAPYQNPQSVNEYGTEEYISTSIIPIGHYTEYPASKKLIKNVTNNYNDIATQNKMGYMSASDKTKLDGIETGAEVNQNAFSNVKVGTTTIFSNTKTDTLELVAGSNITLTPDTTNDKVTIAMTSNMVIQNIASNANLNTITTDGWYMASTDTIASSLSNCPSTKSFLMEVYHINSATGSNEVIYQKISTSENIHYERVKATGTWSEWKSSCHIDLNGVVYI